MNEICPRMFPFSPPCTCPFRSIFILSYPWSVCHAVSNEKKPIPGLTSRLRKRWSCSMRLFTYLLCWSSQEVARVPLEGILTLVTHEGEPLNHLNTLELTRPLSFLQHNLMPWAIQ